MITMTDRELEMYDYIVESGIATARELNLVKDTMGGCWEVVINAVIYARTGKRDFDQFVEERMEG